MSTDTDAETKLWNDAGYVASSTYRKAIFDTIGVESPDTPSGIAEATGKQISHVSRALSDLKERGMVEILNPDARKGRLYVLTEYGSQVAPRAAQISS